MHVNVSVVYFPNLFYSFLSSSGAGFLVREFDSTTFSSKCCLIIIWSLFEEDSIISWFKNISWSHYSKSFTLISMFLLRNTHEFLTWLKFKSLLYVSTNWSASCFSVAFSKGVFRFNTWNISAIAYTRNDLD